MIFSPVRAIAIDNNSLELISIVNGLAAQGIACSAHLYDTGELVPPPPKGGYGHLRLVFVDINLLDAAGFDPKNLASIITKALGSAISADSGPYCLVFWTSYSDKFDEIKPEVERQLEQQNIPLPSLVTYLGKGELIPLTNGKDAEAANLGLRAHIEKQAELSEKLGDSLEKVIKSSGSVGVASAWETLLSEAASNTFKELYSEARQLSAGDHAGAFADLLSTIAVEAIGQKNAKEDPLSALTEGLLDLVLDHLRSAKSSAAAEDAVRAELSARVKAGPATLPTETIARINRLFQVELLAGAAPAGVSRGLVLRPSEQFLKEAGLEEGWATFLWKEVLHDPIRLSGTDEKRPQLLARKEEVSARVRPLLVEVGADCDHAQRKPRSHRFLLAAEVPVELTKDFLASGDPTRRTPYVSDAIEVLGPWPIEGQLASVAICCKRFLSHQLDKLPKDCVGLMRLRSSLVNHLLHRYSTLATRPGFINLRAG
ncbi:hypothetical protein [Ideonella sp.]|uniref:hypothetical protein n=1 Tax=Ideonella sp. TaxID=1929293 RepID=UPI0035ADCE8D